MRLLPSGNLHVVESAAADGGHYTCTASNHITAEVLDSQRVLKLVVKPAPNRPRPLASLWRPEERYIAQIGTARDWCCSCEALSKRQRCLAVHFLCRPRSHTV